MNRICKMVVGASIIGATYFVVKVYGAMKYLQGALEATVITQDKN